MDKSTVLGAIVAAGGLLLGLVLEGGSIFQIIQPTAALIVFGGTIGAVMVQYPLSVFLKAVRNISMLLSEGATNAHSVVTELVGYANKARKEGIISLDNELDNISDPILKKSLMLAIDGTEPQELRKMMELDLDNQTEQEDHIPKVYEAAGGYAPTVGIIGAVMGLIQVMQNLDDIDEVGHGIAVAFVATIYGVGASNLFFLPAAGKLKIRFREMQIVREMILEGVISILEGMNPRMLETKLKGYLTSDSKPEDEDAEEVEETASPETASPETTSPVTEGAESTA